ncbi:MAG: hypothetical protein AB8B93_13745 [Pseudomonadales bacterium]
MTPDLAVAVQCVELCQLAYKTPAEGARIAERSGYLSYRHLESRGGRDFAIIVSDAARHFIAFRGTDEIADWLTNFSLWRTRTAIGAIHAGYYRTCQAMLPGLVQELSRLDKLPLTFTGHSLGGALASISGLYLNLEQQVPLGIYTFGQPRVGGRSFVRTINERYSERYFRFVHGADAIASWGMRNREYAGTLCYFDYRGRLVVDRESRSIPKVGLHFHRMAQYRYLLRLNQLKLESQREDINVTRIDR